MKKITLAVVLIALVLAGAFGGYAIAAFTEPVAREGFSYFELPTADFSGKVFIIEDNQCSEFLKDEDGSDIGCNELRIILVGRNQP